MTFDKETYWKNRKEGSRGQGEYPSLVVGAVALPGNLIGRTLDRKQKHHSATKIAPSSTPEHAARKKKIHVQLIAVEAYAATRREGIKASNLKLHEARMESQRKKVTA